MYKEKLILPTTLTTIVQLYGAIFELLIWQNIENNHEYSGLGTVIALNSFVASSDDEPIRCFIDVFFIGG